MTTIGRTASSDALVKRATEGLLSNKYKQVDYDHLKAMTALKKASGKASLSKVQKLEQVSKQNKEQNLMKQHKRAWQSELSRLDSHRSKYQSDVDSFMLSVEESNPGLNLMSGVQSYENNLEKELASFKKNSVDPVWELRDDLLFWINERKKDLEATGHDLEQESEKVFKAVRSVKIQQEKILNQLHQEQISLENELQLGVLGEVTLHNSNEKDIQTGIPQEAFLLECPDENLKTSVLQEFIFIDQKHIDKLDEIERVHADAIGSETGGWPPDEDFLFQAIIEQYPYNLQNRRQLYIDRLMRHLPHRTRQDIVAHEDWSELYKYYHRRRKDLINDWLRDRRELFNRAVAVFDEAVEAERLDEERAEHRYQQKILCQALYEKVAAWRERKVEVMRLEEELEQERRAREREEARLAEERLQKKRQMQKDKIDKYVKELEEERKAREEEKRQRFEELQALLAEQAARDRERVDFRKEQFHQKVARQKERKEEEEREREETEERLEALREKVRPHVERDLLRVWSDTAAWNAHLKKEEEAVNINQPLFKINTFESSKLTADPRFRVEQRLREAGLLDTNYARQVISTIQPPQPPRRDMQSTVFKNT